MALADHVDLSGFIEGVKRRNPGQPEFVQAVTEVAEDIFDFIQDKEQYHKYQILRRIAEPDRVISFRVVWEDDNNNIRVQRGYRVQNNNAIGPYKGGIRFHLPSEEGVCDVCGSTEFKRRPDDNEQTVRTRMAEYRGKTAPILPYYKQRGIVRRVDGMAPLGEVSEGIEKILGGG